MRAEGGLLWVKRERSGAEHDRDARLSRFSRLNLHWHDLTPELRRTALRPCVSEDHSGLHEAAKRSRLERIVRAHTRMLQQQLLLPPATIVLRKAACGKVASDSQ